MESMQNSHRAVPAYKKLFNRLIQKVQDLQEQQEKINGELDETLQFYYAVVRPDETLFLQHLTEQLSLAYKFYKTGKGFSKSELKLLKSWLAEQADQVCSMHEQDAIPAAMKDIFQELHGRSYDECFMEAMKESAEDFQERFNSFFGDKIDLSDVDLFGSQTDVLRKIFEKIGQAATDFKAESLHAQKTKSQLKKEKKEQALKEIQAKSLHRIYKQLACVLHPDLEQDLKRRMLKEELMKKLTAAYQKNDLYALLSIETEWMNHSVDKMQFHRDNEIKVYNAALKGQIKELEAANGMLLMHPRYRDIQRFYEDGFTGISTLQRQYNGLKQLIQETQEMVALLASSQAKDALKKMMQKKVRMIKSGCTCGSC